MSDVELSSLDELKAKHSKEKKELQAQITSLKHSITKNDKKKKKEVGETIERMEAELKSRHEAEMKELQSKMDSATLNDDNKNGEDVATPESSINTNELVYVEKKPTKTQKKRERKVQEQKRRNELALLDEQNAAFSPGNIEKEAIKKSLQERKLQLVEVAPDGDCMFNALAHQINLELIVPKMTGEELRQKAANYIRTHKDDFIPFLTDDDGEMLNNAGFEDYCLKIENTSKDGGAWGGDIELRAISNVLERPIEVIQGDNRIVQFGEHFSKSPLVITYHRYAYSLGEHYNSTNVCKS